jgi:hypothetical protein
VRERAVVGEAGEESSRSLCGARVFRPKHFKAALVVSEEIKNALAFTNPPFSSWLPPGGRPK